ncbi:duf2439 domain protein [Trichoderma arundinaceum]|uniref:Duf2439 domain protein n=1 Tax=Trichoderma arundinaceum TaxID=490622 RepID=A0A395NUE5_TRIAR|nr:duf2439 domain protein [Trichoderma arundinaceum]
MFYPRRNNGQVNPPAASASQEAQQPAFRSARNSGQATTPVASASRVPQQPMFRPVRSIVSTPSAAAATVPSTPREAQQPTFRSARNSEQANIPIAPAPRVTQQPVFRPVRRVGLTATPTISASYGVSQPISQHISQPITQPIPQPRSAARPSYNPATLISRSPQQPMFQPTRSLAPTTAPNPSALSAPILEFICLYTHDLRRKQKRWQDGKLKFHTFNKKVMVYNDGGSFVGDGHWQGAVEEFAEGLEMNLDRGMAIIQVQECIGSKEQDLGEVLGKRAREVEERRANAAARAPPSRVLSSIAPSIAPSRAPSSIASSSRPPPAKKIRGETVVAAVTSSTATRMKPPSHGEGAWSKHAKDLLGMTRPTRK